MSETQTVEVGATTHPEATTNATHYGPRITDPAVRCGYLDGQYVVYVQLSGHGSGREMILSADRWPEVAARWGRSWLLVAAVDGDRVVGTSGELRRLTGKQLPRLSRLLTDAKPGQKVKHRNGNTLDLRDSNLVVVDRIQKQRKAPRPEQSGAPPTPRVRRSARATVDLTPIARLNLRALKLRHPGSNAEVVEDALCAAVAQASAPVDTEATSVSTPMARQALDTVKALLGRKEGREVSDGEAVAWSLCAASGVLNEAVKGSVKGQQ